MKSKNGIKILSPAKFIKKTEIKPQPIQTTQEIDLPIECSLTKSFSNINYSQPKSRLGSDKWFLVGGSSIGKSHISIGKPCQDNHYCKNIDKNWGISVICDGAGSAENSHLGSQFVSEKTIDVFKDYLVSNKFVSKNKLPNDVEWQNISNLAFRNIYNSLCDFAEKNKIGFSSVACTVIVVVFTPIGLLSSHIGDGRAGYCNVNGEWKSLITPHKGEEANQTIFITSSAWISEKNFKMSDVLVPECRVITEKVTAFTLMTDGCETHSFDCSKMDQETNKWIDPNIPDEKFFNPLLNQLKSMYNNKVSSDEVTSRWLNFIDEGTNGLKNESDDKTLILGVNV
jgi:hypothetical protein